MPILTLLFFPTTIDRGASTGMFDSSEQKVIYLSPDNLEENIKEFKAVAKTLPVPFVLYADFDAI